ncbi:MAG: sodium-translocating pyrophosphatase [Coriobacteriia bacterium]|jgi:K(+)-stimulated pyrophosphate-energized sodium pump|nr:sodium-translocating pyrophosphatase [Coriobacteriia bacterium]MDR2713953.1 sodium-translocating pyrophosphatase [Coriobacteriales bacterium]
MAQYLAWLAPICSIVGIAVAAYLAYWVLKQDSGNERMQKLSGLIQKGAQAFLFAEYRALIIFALVVTVVLGLAIGWLTAAAFLTGGILSVIAGYFGMYVATRANARTTQAATTGIAGALKVAYRSGLTMGLIVASLGLLGLSLWAIGFLVFNENFLHNVEIVDGFVMGASSIALFARVGGGIYTKAADVGADLVGKVEAGIPEDDPRNPGVIADNVGDNVGDVAGMGADLYESYAGAILAPIVLAVAMNAAGILEGSNFYIALVLPLVLAAGGILASIIGLFAVNTNDSSKIHKALNRGTNLTSALVFLMIFVCVLVWQLSTGINALWLFLSAAAGLAAGLAIGKITEYYTSYQKSPTKKIALASESGTATNIIEGLGTGMLSTVLPTLVLVAAVAIAYLAGTALGDPMFGVYGIGLAALGMLSTTATTVGVDSYGPVADNAGGIAEMAGLPPEVRERTDQLDTVGNTTAAVAKGFAVSSAALTALALFVAFKTNLDHKLGALADKGESILGTPVTMLNISLDNPFVIVGVIIGAMMPFFFGAMTMGAVSRAANAMIIEIRRQFKEITGLMEGKAEPDTEACVSISTKAALKEMMLPGILAVVIPVLLGVLDVNILAGFLVGVLGTGFLMSVYMANAGGAWDNAKKYIETGAHGGKGSEAHKAAVVGDTVGDPFKDTSGPSINILIKVVTVVSLVFVPLFITLGGGLLHGIL